jgi:hypothetical protein
MDLNIAEFILPTSLNWPLGYSLSGCSENELELVASLVLLALYILL